MTAVAETSTRRLGVVGAGSMGAGIAQLGCTAGLATTLVDVDPAALERARARIADSLAAGARRGLWSVPEADAALGRLTLASQIETLDGADVVIEAVPEQLELKRATFERLSLLAGDPVLATNTSSLMVAAIASAVRRPERVVGMHFFNPPERMRLVEIIAGPDSAPGALAVARDLALAMSRVPIDVLDRPGFLVNRCLRPFYGEALKLLEEGVAEFGEIDRILRRGGGFRMGAFELLDLVGMDVNLEVTRSFFAQSAGEPRWKPSATQARMVAAGRLGRKSGRGFYDYAREPYRPVDEDAEPLAAPARRVVVLGDTPVADLLRGRIAGLGWARLDAVGAEAELVVDATLHGAPLPADPGAALVVLCAAHSLVARGDPRAAGFHLLPPDDGCRLVELTALPSTPQATIDLCDAIFAQLGLERAWVGDAPGLVLGRVVAQIVNEAAFAIAEGVALPADVDTGVVRGLNHPRGPVQWAREIGVTQILATLDGLWEERREERYRAAPLLRLAAATGGELRRPDVRRPRPVALAGSAA